jgi:tetratricopeptide (TPR) repeat protein
LGVAGALATRGLDFGMYDTREDDLRRADEIVSRVLAIDPNSSRAHYIKGQILRARNRYEEAIIEYETVIALDPMTVTGRSDLARATILIGEPAGAIPLLEQAMKISPRDPSIGYIHFRLGLANLLLGNTDEAIQWSQKAVLTYIAPDEAYWDLGAALALKGDIAGAQAALAKAAQYRPHVATLTGVRGRPPSGRPKYSALLERTLIEGLRKAGWPE